MVICMTVRLDPEHLLGKPNRFVQNVCFLTFVFWKGISLKIAPAARGEVGPGVVGRGVVGFRDPGREGRSGRGTQPNLPPP